MNAFSLLADLRARGADLQLSADEIAINAPRGVLTPQLLADVREHKTAIMATLKSEAAASTETVGTCSARRKRVVLPAPTAAMMTGICSTSFAEAARLRAKLEASGVVFRFSCDAGALHFDEPRLCIEWKTIAREDWQRVLELRAELQKMVAPAMPGVSEIDAGALYEPEYEQMQRAA